jgi:hypothetical protein
MTVHYFLGVNSVLNTFNINEYGDPAIVDVLEDISANTNTIAFKDPAGVETIKPAVVGVANYDSKIGVLLANQYVTYTIESGLITTKGRWYIRAISEGGGKKRKTNWLPFDVKS